MVARTWHCGTCGSRLRERGIGAWSLWLYLAGVAVLLVGCIGRHREPGSGWWALAAAGLMVAGLLTGLAGRRLTLADDGVYCPACGHDRAGNESGTCTECGEPLPDLDSVIVRRKAEP
jgi:hypothetical protein